MIKTRQLANFDAARNGPMLASELTDDDVTQTIDLDQAVGGDLSESGSFNVGLVNVQELSKLFHAIPIPVFLVDKTGTVVFMNDACSKISEDYAALRGRSFASLFGRKAVRAAIQSWIAEAFHTRMVRRLKATMVVNNRAVWGRIHLRPLRMGYERYLLILVEDLTAERAQLLMNRKHQESLQNEIAQRKRAEEVIRQSELKYRMLFDNAPIGIVSVDKKGKILFLNPKASEIMGCTYEDFSEKTFLAFVHEEDRHLVSEGTQDRGADNLNQDGYVCRITAKDAAIKWVEIKSVDIDWNGVPATLKFMQDVTNKRKLEEELSKIQKLESLGLLAGGIAHDFNNILTAILGNISLGRTSLKKVEEAVSTLGDAERACVRAQGLTQQLLTFSKGGVPRKKAAAIGVVIEESCRFAVQGSNVGCHIDVAEDLWPAEVDAAQISQVMQNLAINAAQAMRDGGTIRVKAENLRLSQTNGLPVGPGDYVKITVQDQGVGIPDDILPHIFDPYFTTKSGGSGLGLATAHSIIRNHNGLITVETAAGRGSLFVVYLPATHNEPEPSMRLDEVPTPGKGKVLVMDDDEAVRNLLSEALTALGYQVKATRDGEEALALYASEKGSSDPFVAVILDLTVPGGMGGREAALKLRAMDPEIRLVISSGYSNDPVMAQYEKYGIDAVVPKPYTLAELSRALPSGNGNGNGHKALVKTPSR